MSVTGIAVAAFWFAITLQLIFAMNLEWLPLRGELSSGIVPPPAVTGSLILDALIAGHWDTAADALRHLVLPAVTLSVGALATITRFTRAGMLETMQKDFVLYERAVGYPRWRLVWVYVLRNSVIAAVTQIGLLVRRADRRGGGRRVDLRLAGGRQLPGQRDPDRRLQGHAGRDAADRRRVHAGQHPDRPGAWLARPAAVGAAVSMLILKKFARDLPAVAGLVIVLAIVRRRAVSARGSRRIRRTPPPRICCSA